MGVQSSKIVSSSDSQLLVSICELFVYITIPMSAWTWFRPDKHATSGQEGKIIKFWNSKKQLTISFLDPHWRSFNVYVSRKVQVGREWCWGFWTYPMKIRLSIMSKLKILQMSQGRSACIVSKIRPEGESVLKLLVFKTSSRPSHEGYCAQSSKLVDLMSFGFQTKRKFGWKGMLLRVSPNSWGPCSRKSRLSICLRHFTFSNRVYETMFSKSKMTCLILLTLAFQSVTSRWESSIRESTWVRLPQNLGIHP